ncbi:MAG: CoA pyrophosphatase [Stappiaceae bacterium]
MSPVLGEVDPLDFSANAFRRAVRERASIVAQGDDGGDHLLNPELERADAVRSLRDAAVLIPVIDRDHEATVLLTHRTDNLPSHAGQVAFPGGKIDQGDSDPTAAALRECEEELGLDRHYVDPLLTFPPYLSYSGFRIYPVVATVDPEFTMTINRGEVADVFEVPLRFLMSDNNHEKHGREFKGAQRYYYAMPYKKHHIWGVTAGIIRMVYERLYA